ncbi:Apoptosis-enhancing nuclease [Bagarius yarrelli]|uniref:Apoptosis-enhancing nuclease n=1 Tax=Bagarius yarrelli TaxID=175774 RepID=A0A556TNJ8_BAGYA|nr:Apoptosis-enhancing nuclease [Bagarius yarrelli]
MSAVEALTNSMAAQTAPDLSMESSTLCSVLPKTPRRLKTRRKSKNRSMACQKIHQGLKRKWSDVLQHGSSDYVLEGPQKRTRTLDTNESECAGSLSDTCDVDSGFSSETSPPTSGRCSPCVGVHPSMLLAIDCEMVGTGPNGQFSELARCSLVNYSGTVIYDKYVLPRRPVTDYRTQWSGIKKEHLINALSYKIARKEILQIIKGKVIIGHALHHDFAVLRIKLPRHMIRDTSFSPLLRKLYGPATRCISLKKLTSTLLNRSIQVDSTGHCPVEDALAALDLYKLVEEEWEKSLQPHLQNVAPATDTASSLEHYMQDEYWPDSLND